MYKVTCVYCRLPIVNSPVNRDQICKPTTLDDGRQVFTCPFCSKNFSSYSDINRHMDFHEGMKTRGKNRLIDH